MTEKQKGWVVCLCCGREFNEEMQAWRGEPSHPFVPFHERYALVPVA